MGRLYRPSSLGEAGMDEFPDGVGRPTDTSDSTPGVGVDAVGDQVGVFDPSEHSVDEVNAYLEENPAEVVRVLEAEGAAAGKQRRGVLAGPHAPSA